MHGKKQAGAAARPGAAQVLIVPCLRHNRVPVCGMAPPGYMIHGHAEGGKPMRQVIFLPY